MNSTANYISPNVATYRADIDGLRGLAVLAVVAFHMRAGVLPGGYVGVDVFFVVSGFLITSVIIRNLQQNTFSFRDFYSRRAKRIFPALLAVLFAVLAVGWVFLLPHEYEFLGKHVAAGAGFISNFALWQESGYFDRAAESKPLLHLWSLGIEEQFYLLWPPLLVWAWRRRADVFALAALIVAGSFAINLLLIRRFEVSDAYYLPVARFWELLLGCAFAYLLLLKEQGFQNFIKRLNPNLPAVAGLLLVLAASVLFNEKTPFPGWSAIVPTLGTLLVISAGNGAWINRNVLSWKPLVFVGLISYPLYLWHWPLLSFASILRAAVPSTALKTAIVALAFLLASATYHLVEIPVRSKANGAGLALCGGLAAAGCLGLAVLTHSVHARSEKYGVEGITQAANGKWGFMGLHLNPVHTARGDFFESGTGLPKVLFLGDSHMEQYYPRIDRLITEHPESTKGVFFVTQPSCPPIPHIEGAAPAQCATLVDRALSLVERGEVDTVAIAAAWTRYPAFASGQNDEAFRALETMITTYRKMGIRVYVILPIPRGEPFNPSRLVRRSIRDLGFVVRQSVDRQEVDAAIQSIASRLAGIAKSTGATTINPLEYLCNVRECPTLASDGLPVYIDDSHLRPGYVREYGSFLDVIVRR